MKRITQKWINKAEKDYLVLIKKLKAIPMIGEKNIIKYFKSKNGN